MINPKWHPLLGLCRRLTGHPKKKALLEETDPGDASEVLTETEAEEETDDQEDEDQLADAETSEDEDLSDENEADSEESEDLK